MALALLTACAWRGPMPAQSYPGVESNDAVMTLDKAAYKLVAVRNSAISRGEDGALTVKLELVNLSSLDLAVQVQTLFRDEQGLPSGEDTPFEMIVLPGSGYKLYEVTSLKTSAADFTVQIKTP